MNLLKFLTRKSPEGSGERARKFRANKGGRSSMAFGLSTSASSNLSLTGSGVEDDTFAPDNRPISQAIADDLSRDRGISRMMEGSNDYYVRYLTEQAENVIGGAGFRFQSKILRSNGEYNKPVNDKVEAWWKRQTKADNYTVEGRKSGLDEAAADKLILRLIVRDGFCLIKLVNNFDNGTGFAIQIICGDRLDHTLCTTTDSGSRVVNGVEVDEWGRVRAYYLRAQRGHTRLPADDIICPYIKTDPDQYIGLPWARAVAKTLHGLDQYEESVLITAREAACKALFITQDVEAGEEITDQDLPDVVTPGSTTVLDPGQGLHAYDPAQPTNQYTPFRSGVLMRAASGLNMSYQSLSGDLSQGNFASQRVGLLDEREIWKGKQGWFVNAVKVPIFERGLLVAMRRLAVSESMTFDKLNFPNFRGRRWAWVDPQKDIMAAKIAIDNGLTSRAKVISDSDSDTDEEGVLQEVKRGEVLQGDMDLDFEDRAVSYQEAADEPTNIENIDEQTKQA